MFDHLHALRKCSRLTRQQQPSGTASAVSTEFTASEKQQLDVRGFERIDIPTGGEAQWQTWLWKVRTTVSAMYSDLADVMKAVDRNTSHVIFLLHSAHA